jgi:hypothetical protein
MTYYLGLDVSQKQTALCLVDSKGTIVAEGKTMTNPMDILAWIKTKGFALTSIVRAGLEAGAMSSWLCTELVKSGLNVMCLGISGLSVSQNAAQQNRQKRCAGAGAVGAHGRDFSQRDRHPLAMPSGIANLVDVASANRDAKSRP